MEPGTARDFVLSSGGYPGYAVERYLKGEAPDAAMMVRIVTLSSLADEEEERVGLVCCREVKALIRSN